MGKILRSLFCAAAFLAAAGCSQDNPENNPHFTHARALTSKALFHADHDAVNQLIKESTSADATTKFYATAFLARMLKEPNIIDQPLIIAALVVALDDSQKNVQVAAIQGLANAGSAAVIQGLPKIETLVLSGQNDSVSWRCAAALGVITQPPAVDEVVAMLGKALVMPLANETAPGTAQLRAEAWKSLTKISEKQPALVLGELAKIRPELKGPNAEEVSAFLARLQK
jgi:hypothetical protein